MLCLKNDSDAYRNRKELVYQHSSFRFFYCCYSLCSCRFRWRINLQCIADTCRDELSIGANYCPHLQYHRSYWWYHHFFQTQADPLALNDSFGTGFCSFCMVRWLHTNQSVDVQYDSWFITAFSRAIDAD